MASELWWVSVGGNDCEPARVADGVVFTIGCQDGTPITAECGVELVQKIDSVTVPPTPAQSAARYAEWEARRAAERKRGVVHGYRRFD